MLSRDKRASLSSSLLGAKDNAPPGAEDAAPAEAPEVDADGAAADARQDAKAEPEAGSNVLYAKGAASASGFRPWYWSYERDGKPQPEGGAETVTLFPASAVAPASSPALADTPAAEPDAEDVAPPLPAIAADEPAAGSADPEDDVAATAQAMRRARLQRPQTGALDRAAPNAARRSRLLMVAGGGVSLVVAAAIGAFFALSLERPGSEPAPLSAASPQPAATAVATPPAKPTESAAAKPAAAPAKTKETVAAAKPEPKPTIAAPPPVAAAPPAVPPSPSAAPAVHLSPQEVAALLARGDQLLATGDIAAARLFYERAAEQGSAPAATAAGKTYDPLFLEEVHARGIRGDVVKAAQWYRKASAAGDKQADIRMERLMARYGG